MPRTLITTKVKLRHIPSIGENTQKFSAPKRKETYNHFQPLEHAQSSQQMGDDFLPN